MWPGNAGGPRTDAGGTLAAPPCRSVAV